ncbi:Protein kinase, catalytic domain-containing protein [Cynara cardunculus var. scolymus]|uniref:Protein kinase, catalytic domain-containing protein n=1 Tax=Cynara cardunculus var. scolymus TaxID=59895 RepID=A0A124SEY4_CYNCS|nr:Protein kinase, catalytic domain-containing protein [Cynara cardunculus var. scolymus]
MLMRCKKTMLIQMAKTERSRWSGGFGKVHKGVVNSGSSLVVATIERLNSISDQGATEFWAEVEMLSKFRHCTLVSLIGYCIYEKETILVYEYMPNGTLEDHLHKLGTPFSWLQPSATQHLHRCRSWVKLPSRRHRDSGWGYTLRCQER